MEKCGSGFDGIAEKGLRELLGVENLEIIDFLADTYIFYRNLHLVGDSNDHTSAGCPVKLRDGEAVHIGGCRELARLLEGILSGRSVEDEEYFVWRIRYDPLHHFLDFRQLVHQANLIMETPGGINDDDIRSLRLGGGEVIVF